MRKSVVLPEPFGPDQPDLLAGVQLKGGVDEDELLAVLLIDVGERNHAELLWYEVEAIGNRPLRQFRYFG